MGDTWHTGGACCPLSTWPAAAYLGRCTELVGRCRWAGGGAEAEESIEKAEMVPCSQGPPVHPKSCTKAQRDPRLGQRCTGAATELGPLPMRASQPHSLPKVSRTHRATAADGHRPPVLLQADGTAVLCPRSLSHQRWLQTEATRLWHTVIPGARPPAPATTVSAVLTQPSCLHMQSFNKHTTIL